MINSLLGNNASWHSKYLSFGGGIILLQTNFAA